MATTIPTVTTAPVHDDVSTGHPRYGLWHVPSRVDPTRRCAGRRS